MELNALSPMEKELLKAVERMEQRGVHREQLLSKQITELSAELGQLSADFEKLLNDFEMYLKA